MLLSAWMFLGVVAILSTGVAVSTNDDAKATLAGIVGTLSWGAWSWGALDIRVVEGSTTYQFAQPELTWIGIAIALVPAYIMLFGPFEAISRVREPEQQDV